ncbi:MAG: hypothetical protein JSS28_02500 [Proteobacteria bacterium]|nr:hypothetical protein [Pseudomonadota bacterium]
MRKMWHWWFTLLFVWALAYDLVVWGAAGRLPGIGGQLQDSAQRQALLAHLYMYAGGALDGGVPILDDWGTQRARTALSDGFARIKEDPMVSMDLIFSNTWNSTHAWLKFMYWAAPAFGVIALVLWSRRPRKVSLVGRR